RRNQSPGMNASPPVRRIHVRRHPCASPILRAHDGRTAAPARLARSRLRPTRRNPAGARPLNDTRHRRCDMPEISKAKVLILATNGFEQVELLVPRRKLKEAGAQVDVVSPEKGEIRGWKLKDWGESVTVDKSLDEVNADDYDAIVLPGGQINPDLLRVNPKALQLIRSFLDSGKVVAAICHAPWLLV